MEQIRVSNYINFSKPKEEKVEEEEYIAWEDVPMVVNGKRLNEKAKLSIIKSFLASLNKSKPKKRTLK